MLLVQIFVHCRIIFDISGFFMRHIEVLVLGESTKLNLPVKKSVRVKKLERQLRDVCKTKVSAISFVLKTIPHIELAIV